MKIITKNRKAFHDYEIIDTIEAGLQLQGDEVKSIRSNGVSLTDSYGTVYRGELFLLNCYIAPYAHAYSKEDKTRRTRKLLLHKKEITRLIGDISRKGLTLIPLKLYFNKRGYVKIELGLAKARKRHDKKQQLRERDIARETDREIKSRV